MMDRNTAIVDAEFRPEIQGLRAIAALAVVFFHIWPQFMPGGYVGVDIFFVISGFLITSLLLREAERSGRVALGRFYWRRAWRLLPMALFVLMIVAAFTPVFLPPSQWKGVATEIIASAFYFENWLLAALSVDYLGAAEAPSPVQHYWSLSIEEQFYVFWPGLVIVGLWLARRFRAPLRSVLGYTLIAASAVSLILSVLLAQKGAPNGYFLTQARIWELGLGGILAVWPPVLGEHWRRLCGFTGIAAILAAALLFSAQTPFPGSAALLPTSGAALVILSGRSTAFFSIYQVLKTKLFQLLGDASYSVYLWHWPLVIFYRMSRHDQIDLTDGTLMLAAIIGLSVLSKRYIEDRFRRPEMTWTWWRKAIPFALLALFPIPVWGWSYHQITQQQAAIVSSPENYPGAMVLAADATASEKAGLAPPPAFLRFDKAEVYDNGCHLGFVESEPVACRYGDLKGAFKVFLIGDSHAANWIPAFDDIAERLGWNAASYTKSSCPLMPITLSLEKKPYEECLIWGQKMMSILARERPKLVILAQMRAANPYVPPGTANRPSMTASLTSLWREIEELGAQVVVIADTPAWPTDPDVCLFKDKQCALHLSSTHAGDPLIAAAQDTPSVTLVDLNNYLCPGGVCPVVIGNVIVWRDQHHLTATYSRSLAPLLEQRLDGAIQQIPPRANSPTVSHNE